MTRSAKPRILFYFLHLLGVGHVYRAQRLIGAFANSGLAVDAIIGGEPVEGLEFEAETVHYLPAIRAVDESYSAYLDANGMPLDKPFLDMRCAKLLDIFDRLDPDLILIEAFPFGRRMVRHELLALLAASSRRAIPPFVVSSVRDILQEKRKAGRAQETRDIIQAHFDHVLVHSDPDVIRLDETFPLTAEIADKVSYTGFVLPPAAAAQSDAEKFDVIVSAGGGAFGGELMETALQVALSNPLPGTRWCLATGPNLPSEMVSRLHNHAPDHVTIRTRLENLSAHLMKARVSISQCGYNTAMDVLAVHRKSQCRAVFVPYDTKGQTEQLRRAQLLEATGYATCVPQSEVTPTSLGQAILEAASLPQIDHLVNFNGSENSARLIKGWLAERTSP